MTLFWLGFKKRKRKGGACFKSMVQNGVVLDTIFKIKNKKEGSVLCAAQHIA